MKKIAPCLHDLIDYMAEKESWVDFTRDRAELRALLAVARNARYMVRLNDQHRPGKPYNEQPLRRALSRLDKVSHD
jgi:hypothetical protein